MITVTSQEDGCTCRHIRGGHAGRHRPENPGKCLVSVRVEDIGKRKPRPCPCTGFELAEPLLTPKED